MRHRRDLTHSTVIEDLRKMGYSVFSTADCDGFVDAVMAKYGHTALLEIKTPQGKLKAQERRSEGQATFAEDWKGHVITAYTAEAAHLEFMQYVGSTGYIVTGAK